MNLLDTLTRAADEEQLRLRPLPDHAAATQAEHLRRHYALLLAAVLTAQPTISEPQTRLLRLLLDALKLGDLRGMLFEQARELTPEPLLEAARLIREAGFAHHLVLDALVLLRLDAPLGDEAARLAGELAAFLGLDEVQLSLQACDAADILGINTNAGQKEYSNTNKKTDIYRTEKTTMRLPELIQFWPGKLRYPLTSKALRDGLQSGFWVLEKNLEINFPWQANNVTLLFKNGATLKTIAEEGSVEFTNCRFVDAVMNFQGECSISLENCDWKGDYDPVKNITALNSNQSEITIRDCYFSTKNARAIKNCNTLNIERSHFLLCGNHEMHGGAIAHLYGERKIENCTFDRCFGGYGGAIFAMDIYGISNCEFISCESRSLKEDGAQDIAVIAIRNTENNILDSCVFRHTSVSVGNSISGRGRYIASNCNFIKGSLYFHLSDNHVFGGKSKFDGGRVIEKYFDIDEEGIEELLMTE